MHLYILAAVLVLPIIFFKQIKKFAKGEKCNIQKDLCGKVAIITGSNTGIGYETAKRLIKSGCTVILACRDKARGQEAEQQLKKDIIQENAKKNQKVMFMEMDLSDLQSVEQFSIEFQKQFNQLDILVNNAGIMFVSGRQLTKDGFEMQVGVNHMGHFHLINNLMEILKKTALKSNDVRVINLSSIAYMQNFGRIQWNNYMAQNSYDMKTQYSISKLSNIYCAKYFASQLDKQEEGGKNIYKDKIKFVSLHPGVVETELFRHVFQYKLVHMLYQIARPLLIHFFKTPFEGAQTSIYTCLEDILKLQNGAYYSECQKKKLYSFAEDAGEIEKLQRYSTSLINNSIEKRSQKQ